MDLGMGLLGRGEGGDEEALNGTWSGLVFAGWIKRIE